MIYELHEERRREKKIATASTSLLHMPGMIAGSFFLVLVDPRACRCGWTAEHLPPFMQKSVLGNGVW